MIREKYGFSGSCYKGECRTFHDWSKVCFSRPDKRGFRNFKFDNKIQCGDCKHFKLVKNHTVKLFNTPLKLRCVMDCANYDGFLSDHTTYIQCKVTNHCYSEFKDSVLKECKHFIQKKKYVKITDRFSDLDVFD